MFQTTVTISTDADTLWHWLTTPELMAKWMGDVTDLRTEDGGSLKPGSVLRFRTQGREVTSHVTDCVPGRALAFTSTQGPFKATYRYQIEGSAPCQLTHQIKTDASGLFKMIRPLVHRALVKADGAQAQRIAEAIKAGSR